MRFLQKYLSSLAKKAGRVREYRGEKLLMFCISTLVIGIQIYKHLRFINIQRKLCPLTKWEKDDSIHFLCGHHSNNGNNQDSDKQNNEHFHTASFFHLLCYCYQFWRWRWCADAWGDLRGESGGEGAWATSLQCGWALLSMCNFRYPAWPNALLQLVQIYLFSPLMHRCAQLCVQQSQLMNTLLFRCQVSENDTWLVGWLIRWCNGQLQPQHAVILGDEPHHWWPGLDFWTVPLLVLWILSI